MRLDGILKGYDKRASIVGAYHLLISTCINRSKFTDFSNEEFTNLAFQILCLLMDKSFKRENCFLEDIASYISELDDIVYKKNMTSESVRELASYITNNLHGSKPYQFSFYNFERNTQDFIDIKLIEAKELKVGSTPRLSYSLTDDGYRLLLTSKEYDDMIQIEIKQVIAKLRIEKEDFDGAKDEVIDIIHILEMQFTKVERFFKEIRRDVFHPKKESFVDVFDSLLSALEEQGVRYEQINSEVLKSLEDKNQLSSKGNLKTIDWAKIQTQLKSLKDLLALVKKAKGVSSQLISKFQEFISDYDEILKKLLRVGIQKKFDFKEVILDTIEKDASKADKLKFIYRDLFPLNPINIFTLDVPYKIQSQIKENEDNESIVSQNEFEVCQNEDRDKFIEHHEKMYVEIIKTIVLFGLENPVFTLKDLLSYLISTNQCEYIKFTSDAMIFRNIFITLVDLDTISTQEIINELNTMAFSPDAEFQIQRVYSNLINSVKDFTLIVNMIKITETRESISINSEINLTNMTSKCITMPNIKFEIS